MEGAADTVDEPAEPAPLRARRLAREALQVVRFGLRRFPYGRAPGLVLLLIFCGLVLASSVRESDRYYATHLVAADNSYYLMGPALVVSGKNDFPLKKLIQNPAPIHSSDGGTEIYVLPNFVAYFLRGWLPLRPAMAVYINGVWFIAMAVCMYLLFWTKIQRWSTTALVTAAYLMANPFLSDVFYGLTSVDPNLLGFMLGSSALACVLLSDDFQRTLPCLFAGFFLGALVLGRAYTLGVVLPAILPYALRCFWRRSREQMIQSLSGGLFTISVAALVCGWWLKGSWRLLLAYPTQYGEAGVLAKADMMDTFLEWCHFPKVTLERSLLLICVLTWPFAGALLNGDRRWRSFNWAALWAAVVPMLVLAKMGTAFQPYGAVALFGAYVLLLHPFPTSSAVPLVRHPGFAGVLAVACALSSWAFFREQHNVREGGKDNKRAIVNALTEMRDHAKQEGRKHVTLGLTYWGTVHDASLVDALIFDAGVRVTTPTFLPRRRRGAPLTVDVRALDPWASDTKVKGKNAVTADAWASELGSDADYVLVLAGGRYQRHRPGRWRPWIDASQQIRYSPAFRPLGSIFSVPADGYIQLLVRRDYRHE